MPAFRRIWDRLVRRRLVRETLASVADRRPALGLERLEDRATPAIVVGSTDDSNAWIEDVGSASTTLEIIDDLAANTTYYRVDGGAERVLGTAGVLQTIGVKMGAGNDKVSFSARNGTGVSVGLYRSVDLGSGNDSLAIDTAVAGAFVLYDVVDAAGAEQYSFGAAATTAGSLRVNLTDSAGSDRYSTTATAAGADAIFALYLDDVAGNDRYAFGGSATAGGRLFASVVDRAGNDSYAAGAVATGGQSNLVYNLDDRAGNDKYAFAGAATDAGGYYVDLLEAAGDDSYAGDVNVGAAASKFSFTLTDALGNDKYSFTGDAAGADATHYVALADASGNDSYSLAGAASGAAATVSFAVTDSLGNDKYVAGGASSAAASWYAALTDANGADKYTTAGSASGSSLTVQVTDSDAASGDSFAFTPTAAADAEIHVAANLGGGNNSFKIAGARFTAGSVFTVDFDAGSGQDSVSIDDVAIVDSETTYEIDLGAGNDSVALKLDGVPKSGAAVSNATDAVKNATYKVNLGDGADSFAATVYSTWSLLSQSAAGAGLVLVVHGDAGNDKLAFQTKSSSAPFAFAGPASRFYLNLFGDDGDDALAFGHGSFQVNDAAASDSQAFFTLQGGEGKDKLSIAGTFLASAGTTTFNVDLGAGDDSLTTSVVTTKTTQLPTIAGAFFGGAGVNKLSVKKNAILADHVFDFV